MSNRNFLIHALSILIFLLLLSTSVALAHPGNTDSSGCHTCRTNCSSWGLYYGEYHCHEPKYYSPPEIYTPPPSCPLFSSYDSISDSCKCYSGYIASGDRCISQDDWCHNQLGFSSRYNTLSNSCECSYGYVYDGSKCISGDQYCWNKYGLHTSYDSLNESCKCSYGYVFNEASTQCISQDEWCRDRFGFSSEYDSLEDSCVCLDGYRFDGDECVLDISDYDYEPASLNIPSSPIFEPTQPPIPKKTPKPGVPSSETQTESPSPTTTEPTEQQSPPYNLHTELKLNSKGEEVKVLQSALAADKEIYPEGIISGFFGTATENAVKRFQGRYGLEETGIMDSQALAKFNEVFGGQNVSVVPTPTPEPKEGSWPGHLLTTVWKFIASFWKD